MGTSHSVYDNSVKFYGQHGNHKIIVAVFNGNPIDYSCPDWAFRPVKLVRKKVLSITSVITSEDMWSLPGFTVGKLSRTPLLYYPTEKGYIYGFKDNDSISQKHQWETYRGNRPFGVPLTVLIQTGISRNSIKVGTWLVIKAHECVIIGRLVDGKINMNLS